MLLKIGNRCVVQRYRIPGGRGTQPRHICQCEIDIVELALHARGGHAQSGGDLRRH